MTPAPDDLLAKYSERIAEIDAHFEGATSWGSWMVMYANERENLVNKLAAMGMRVPHKYLARTEDGGSVD